MRFIDLTRNIDNETQVGPYDKTPVVEKYCSADEVGVNVKFLKMGTHTATHIDVPFHINSSGKAIDDFPPEAFIGKGAVLDFSDKGPIYEITRDDIMKHAAELKGADAVVLNTGWAKYSGMPDFFCHPFLSGAAAQALVDLGIRIVGTDGSSVDAAYECLMDKELVNPEFEEILRHIKPEDVKHALDAHAALLGNECIIVEYLCNLEQLPKELAWYSFLPLKITKGDGSPVRAVCAANE